MKITINVKGSYLRRKKSRIRRKRRRRRGRRKEKNIVINNKMAINKYLLLITLNVNGTNTPIKRHRAIERMRKQDPYILSTRPHLRMKVTHRLKVKGWKKYFIQMELKNNFG